jgi:hypothetical protein
MSETSEKFDCWAVVEVMGHQRYAGRVTEQAIGGCAFVRVDVPAVEGRLPYTKLLGQGSIFAITPVSEAVARNVAAQSYAKPVEVYAPAMQQALSFNRGATDDNEMDEYEGCV